MTLDVAAVLSGGGAKAAAHIGMVRAMGELDLEPTRFVGTSMGAVMAACFAAGLPYDEVLRRASTISRSDVAAISPRMILGPFGRSLLREAPLRETLEALVPVRRFRDLEVPLTVTAVDAESGDVELFGTGGRERVDLIDALYASCALPMYYPPGRIGDREYLDGGVRMVLPLDAAATFRPDLIVAGFVGPSRFNPSVPARLGDGGMVAAHRRTIRIMMSVQTEELLARWRHRAPVPYILVTPDVTGGATFTVERVIQFVESGYRAAYRAIDDWRRREETGT